MLGSDIQCTHDQNSATECQRLCQRTDECAKFVYVTDRSPNPSLQGMCCLKRNVHIDLTDQIGTIAGPKYCPGGRDEFDSQNQVILASPN